MIHQLYNAMHKKFDMLESILIIIIIYINACEKWKAKEQRFYMYKAAKRHCMVGSQLRSTISNMIKFLPLLLGL